MLLNFCTTYCILMFQELFTICLIFDRIPCSCFLVYYTCFIEHELYVYCTLIACLLHQSIANELCVFFSSLLHMVCAVFWINSLLYWFSNIEGFLLGFNCVFLFLLLAISLHCSCTRMLYFMFKSHFCMAFARIALALRALPAFPCWYSPERISNLNLKSEPVLLRQCRCHHEVQDPVELWKQEELWARLIQYSTEYKRNTLVFVQHPRWAK